MTTATKISIRLRDKTLVQAESFAKVHGMSRSGAIEFFAMLGIQTLARQDAEKTIFAGLEGKLKAMQKSNYRHLAYLALTSNVDKERGGKATMAAQAATEKNIEEIFGNEKE